MIVDLYVLDKLSNKYCLKTPLNVCNNYGYIFIQLKMTVMIKLLRSSYFASHSDGKIHLTHFRYF